MAGRSRGAKLAKEPRSEDVLEQDCAPNKLDPSLINIKEASSRSRSRRKVPDRVGF